MINPVFNKEMDLAVNPTMAISTLLEDVKAKSETLSSSGTAPSNQDILDFIGTVAGLLTQLEGSIANSQNIKAQMNADISNKMVQSLQSALVQTWQQVEQNIAAIQAQEEAQAHESLWNKIINSIMIVVGAVLSIIDPPTGIMMMAMGVMNLTNAMSSIQEGVSDLLQKMGMPADVANLTADCLIFAAIVASTFLTGGGNAGELVSTGQKVVQTVLKLVTSIGEALTLTPNLMADAGVVYADTHNLSAEDKQKLENLLNIIQMCIGVLLSIGGSLTTSGLKLSQGPSYLSKIVKNAAPELTARVASNVAETWSIAVKGLEEQFPSLVKAVREVAAAKMSVILKTAIYSTKPACDFSNAVNGAVASGKTATILEKQSKIELALAELKAAQTIYTEIMSEMNSISTSDVKMFGGKITALNTQMGLFMNAILTMGQAETNAMMA